MASTSTKPTSQPAAKVAGGAGGAPPTRPAPKKAPRGLARAPTLLARAARLDASAPWDKDDLLDALFFMRTLAAIAAGVGFGLAGVTGGMAAIGFGVAAAAGGLAWARAVGVEDDEAYGGQNALLCEGLAPGGMALFLVRGDQRERERRVGCSPGEGGALWVRRGGCSSPSPHSLRSRLSLFHSCAGSWCTPPRRPDITRTSILCNT